MFSLSVILSKGGIPGSMSFLEWVSLVSGSSPGWGWVCPGGEGMSRGYSPPTASGSHHAYNRQMGGTHPTGMLSC